VKIQNKVAVVTGAGSGMGKAIARLFAKEGAKVIVADMNMETVNAVVGAIITDGGTAKALAANVTNENDVQSMVNTAVAVYGTLDILVNNAGIMDNFVPAAAMTDELWEKVFAVNVTGPMRLIRKSLPIFIEKKSGVIINIASAGGLLGSRAGAAYTASKHAVVGLTKNVGFQYAKLGIRCNAIAPGAVNTNIGKTLYHPDAFGMERAMAGMNLNPRIGEPEEIARIALFLSSEDSSFINGTVITADSGWTAY
jgi:NAD(P)-dependent dehydrogenase (short-subunit alcohol dehydrogenase family)